MPQDDLDLEELDDELDDDENDDGSDEPKPVRQLREQNKRMARELKEARKAREELTSLKRVQAFKDAGVDLDSKAGKLFAKAYGDGEIDAVKIRAEAVEYGVVDEDTPTPPDAGDNTDVTDAEKEASETRRRVAAGAENESGKVKPADVKAAAIQAAKDALADGKSSDDAMGIAIDAIFSAAQAGDKSVLWDPTA